MKQVNHIKKVHLIISGIHVIWVKNEIQIGINWSSPSLYIGLHIAIGVINWNLYDNPLLQHSKGIIVMCMIISSLTSIWLVHIVRLLRSCITNEMFKIYSLPLLLEWLLDLVVVYDCSWASEPKYLIYFGLPTSDKYNLDKITV